MAIVNSTVLYIGNLQWWSCNDLGLKKNSKKNADMSFSFNLTLCINYRVSVDELFIKLEAQYRICLGLFRPEKNVYSCRGKNLN